MSLLEMLRIAWEEIRDNPDKALCVSACGVTIGFALVQLLAGGGRSAIFPCLAIGCCMAIFWIVVEDGGDE